MKSLQSKSWLVGLVCQVMVVGFSLPAFGQLSVGGGGLGGSTSKTLDSCPEGHTEAIVSCKPSYIGGNSKLYCFEDRNTNKYGVMCECDEMKQESPTCSGNNMKDGKVPEAYCPYMAAPGFEDYESPSQKPIFLNNNRFDTYEKCSSVKDNFASNCATQCGKMKWVLRTAENFKGPIMPEGGFAKPAICCQEASSSKSSSGKMIVPVPKKQ